MLVVCSFSTFRRGAAHKVAHAYTGAREGPLAAAMATCDARPVGSVPPQGLGHSHAVVARVAADGTSRGPRR